MDSSEKMPRKKVAWARWLMVLWVVLGGCAAAFLPLGQWLKQFSEWILTLGWIAPFVYIWTYVGFCIFLIPSPMLSLLVAPVFGFWNGLLYTIVGANLGGNLAFFLGRTVLRRRVEEWARDKPRFQAIDAAVATNALKIVLLMRMSPLFPFTILNYVLALTRIRYWQFAVGTFFGMLPLNVAFIYVSCETLKAVNEVEQAHIDVEKLGLRIAGIVMAIVSIIVVSRIAVRALKQASGTTIPDSKFQIPDSRLNDS